MSFSKFQIKIMMIGAIILGLNAMVPPWRDKHTGKSLGRRLVILDNDFVERTSTWVGNGYSTSSNGYTGEIDVGALLAETILIACITSIIILRTFPDKAFENDKTVQNDPT